MQSASRRRSTVRRGFTLIELLLVLVILAVLAAIVVPKFTGRAEQSKIAAAKTDISNMETSLEAFEVDNGHYPADLSELVTAPSNAQNWHGPYVKRVPNDPWGNAYIYKFPGTTNANGFDLVSLGPDGREGNDDISN